MSDIEDQRKKGRCCRWSPAPHLCMYTNPSRSIQQGAFLEPKVIRSSGSRNSKLDDPILQVIDSPWSFLPHRYPPWGRPYSARDQISVVWIIGSQQPHTFDCLYQTKRPHPDCPHALCEEPIEDASCRCREDGPAQAGRQSYDAQHKGQAKTYSEVHKTPPAGYSD